MLAELEEVVEYKLAPERRSTIREMWWKRLQVLATLLCSYYTLPACAHGRLHSRSGRNILLSVLRTSSVTS
jgi:hypothetical protein